MASYGARLTAYEKIRERTIERRRRGLCTKCGKNRATLKAYCESCLEKSKRYKESGKE